MTTTSSALERAFHLLRQDMLRYIDAVEELMKNGRKAIKGKCPTCGTVMFKILGGKSAPKAAARETPSA